MLILPTLGISRLGTAVATLLAVVSLSIRADEVRLADGGKLSGKVISIDEGGSLILDSPLAIEPLSLPGEAVKQVKFEPGIGSARTGNTRVQLTNGDFFVAKLRDFSRENGLLLDSHAMGELRVATKHLHSLTLAVGTPTVIYEYPDDLKLWMSDNQRNPQNWSVDGETWTVDGSGQIGRMFELPDHYVIRTVIRWQGQPNFRLSFSDPLRDASEPVDRYYLQFGRAGLEIKREASQGPRYHTIGILNRSPDQFANNTLDLELRVDRKESMIHLAINGVTEGRFADPIKTLPKAGGISLLSNASRGNSLRVRSLRIESGHDNFGMHRAEEPGDPTRDTMVLAEGDRYSGILQGIQNAGDDPVFLLKSDIRDKPLEIPMAETSMIQFAANDPPAADKPAEGSVVIRTDDGGRLSVSNSSFTGEVVRAGHALLGDLTLAKSGVIALEKFDSKANPDSP